MISLELGQETKAENVGVYSSSCPLSTFRLDCSNAQCAMRYLHHLCPLGNPRLRLKTDRLPPLTSVDHAITAEINGSVVHSDNRSLVVLGQSVILSDSFKQVLVHIA